MTEAQLSFEELIVTMGRDEGEGLYGQPSLPKNYLYTPLVLSGSIAKYHAGLIQGYLLLLQEEAMKKSHWQVMCEKESRANYVAFMDSFGCDTQS
ncbi:MAG: hypothetical protein CMF50_03550 [Legionellales bacterium]|nr:hypothetical protein [Legionellales bacterium]|tara:strand:- start:2550 stop:2834 length:285 start_codon:yes stop_codon:yes gene_type:complete